MMERVHSASPEAIRRDPGNSISVAQSATAGQSDRRHEFGLNCSMCVHGADGGQNLLGAKTQITEDRRVPLSAFPVHSLCRIGLPRLWDCAAASAA